MNIINQLTLRYLKQNKKRTILTLFCITVSVIMISCVGISLYSGQQFYSDYVVKTKGDYHYMIVDYNKEIVDIMKKDPQVKEIYFSSSEGCKIDDRYISLKNGDQRYYEKENYQDLLIQGRLPRSPNEIVIAQQYFLSLNLHYQIGDTLSLIHTDKDKPTTKQYKVVGYIQNYQAQNTEKKSFNALSYIDLRDPTAYYTMYVHDKNFDESIFQHTQNLITRFYELKDHGQSDFSFRFNTGYLSSHNIFEANSESLMYIAFQLTLFILIIIIFISLFIIYQAFQLSLNDRVQYLGMLSSVGATAKQKRKSVYFEGMILSLIAIPLGIIISYIGLSITFMFINQLEYITSLGITVKAQISFIYTLFVIMISFITIFISLYLPARKISKISVLDALKKEDEIKVKKKSLKTLSFLKINQQLALKNYKRQGKRSKIIVASLVLSMVSFISVYAFGKQTLGIVDEANTLAPYDVEMSFFLSQLEDIQKIFMSNDKIEDYTFVSQSFQVTSVIDTSYLNIPYQYLNQSDEKYHFTILGYNDEKIKELCKLNHIPYQKDITLFDNRPFTYLEEINNGQYTEKKVPKCFKKMDQNFIKSMTYQEENENKTVTQLQLPGTYHLIEKNPYIFHHYQSLNRELYIIVPLHYTNSIQKNVEVYIDAYITSKQHAELTKDLKDMNFYPRDYTASVLQEKQLFLIVNIFIYGFVCIMIIFTLLNIINMMSASIDKRKKEFAMLMSVGMSSHSIQKMIWSECFIYGLKTIFYGIPICLIIELIIHYRIIGSESSFTPSIMAYVASFITIMIVMLLTFKICLNRFQKQNIIESLKDDM